MGGRKCGKGNRVCIREKVEPAVSTAPCDGGVCLKVGSYFQLVRNMFLNFPFSVFFNKYFSFLSLFFFQCRAFTLIQPG